MTNAHLLGTFFDPVCRHRWLWLSVRVPLKNVPLCSPNDLVSFCVRHIDPMAGGVGVMPLRESGLAFFSRLAFENVPESIVRVAVAVVQSSH